MSGGRTHGTPDALPPDMTNTNRIRQIASSAATAIIECRRQGLHSAAHAIEQDALATIALLRGHRP